MGDDVGSTASVRRWPLAGLSLFAGGLLLFGALAGASRWFDGRTEQRLLSQQTQEAGILLTLSVDQYRAPLAAAALAAGATDGSVAVFTALLEPIVGDDTLYTRAALFEVGSTLPRAVVGEGPLLLGTDEIGDLVADSPEPLQIVDLLDAGRVLGYAVHDQTARSWVVYAERTLSDNPNVRRRTDEPFSELNYAIYLGPVESPAALLGASTGSLPLSGTRAVVDIPFGDHQLRVVTTARGRLGNHGMQALWWIVLGGGVVASGAVAWLVERTLASRRRAQELAVLTEALYQDQRERAETLQLSLLPALTSRPPATEVVARYWPAGTVQLIGGDFYDVFRIGEDRWGILIGDVCGKGVEAAGLTGLARFSVQAAARYCSAPSEMLRAMHAVLREQQTATFCTACLIVLEPLAAGGGSAQVSLAGHPAPIARWAGGTVSELGRPGSILGWFDPELHDVTVDLAAGDLLVLYTDGLTDAPGDQGVPLVELKSLIRRRGAVDTLDDLAAQIRALKRGRRPQGSADDTVLLCLRFVDPDDQAGSSPTTR